MEKGIRILLVVLVIFSLVSLTSGVRFFLAEREAFAKYMKVKEALEQATVKWEKELARTEEEKGKLRSKLDAVSQRRSELEVENRALTEAKDNLTLHRDNLAFQRNNLALQVVDLEKKIAAMESELYVADLLKERATLEVEARNLKEGLKSREAELGKIVQENEELKSELARLETEGQVAEALSRDLAKVNKDRYIAIEALGRLEAENRELQERFAQLDKAKALLEERLVVADERLLKAEDERDKFAKKLVSARLALKESGEELEELKGRSATKAKEEIEALERLEAENRELQERFAQLDETKALLEERLVVADERVLKAEDERDRFVKKLVSAKLALKEGREEFEELRARLAKAKEEAEELDSARLALKESGEELEEVKARLTKAGEERKVDTQRKDASIELPPIVVKAKLTPGTKKPSVSPQGRIVTVNDEYKFVVIDLGKEDGIKVGMPFIVYRGDEEIGHLEIIEAHQRVSAADVKKVKERMSIKVDDVVAPRR